MSSLLDGGFPLTPKTGVGWKLMDTYGYAGEDFCQKVDSMEFAFDASGPLDGGYLAFIDEVFSIFDDLYARDLAAPGLLALRYTRRSAALIGMTRFPVTCHIEIPLLRHFAGTDEAVRRIQGAAIRRGGVPHWGQLMGEYNAADVAALHGDDLVTWRRQLAYLIRETPGAKPATWPWRENRSEDFAHVLLRDGTRHTAPLNQDASGQWMQWDARGEYTRDVPLPSGTTWSDVTRIELEHRAAGPDFAADNWTMNRVTVSSVSTAGVVLDRFSAIGSPLHQFRKNDHQVWGQSFP